MIMTTVPRRQSQMGVEEQRLRIRFIASSWCLLVMTALAAASVPAQQLLIIHGGESKLLTRQQLNELPTVNMVTDTPWTNTTATYTGVRLNVLTELLPVQAPRRRVRLVALNDYSVTASLDLLLDADATLVYERNGEPMPVRDYGPFWLLFPFSDQPGLARPEIRDVSVWQLQRLEFLP